MVECYCVGRLIDPKVGGLKPGLGRLVASLDKNFSLHYLFTPRCILNTGDKMLGVPCDGLASCLLLHMTGTACEQITIGFGLLVIG